MQMLSRGSPSATRQGGHHYPQCRLPSFAELTAASGTGGYSEVSLRLRGLAVSRLPPVPITFVRCAHCGYRYWGLLRGQPSAGRIGGAATTPSADCLRSLRSLWQSVLGDTQRSASGWKRKGGLPGGTAFFGVFIVSGYSCV